MGIIFSNNNKKIKEQQRLIDDLESDLQILKHNLLEICVKYNELKKHIIDAHKRYKNIESPFVDHNTK